MYPLFLPDFNKFEFPQHYWKHLNIEFHENPSSASRQTHDEVNP